MDGIATAMSAARQDGAVSPSAILRTRPDGVTRLNRVLAVPGDLYGVYSEGSLVVCHAHNDIHGYNCIHLFTSRTMTYDDTSTSVTFSAMPHKDLKIIAVILGGRRSKGLATLVGPRH